MQHGDSFKAFDCFNWCGELPQNRYERVSDSEPPRGAEKLQPAACMRLYGEGFTKVIWDFIGIAWRFRRDVFGHFGDDYLGGEGEGVLRPMCRKTHTCNK